MSAILVKSDSIEDLKMLRILSMKLGGSVINVDDEQFEDFSLGMLMDKVKTKTNVSRTAIIKKLRKE